MGDGRVGVVRGPEVRALAQAAAEPCVKALNFCLALVGRSVLDVRRSPQGYLIPVWYGMICSARVARGTKGMAHLFEKRCTQPWLALKSAAASSP